MRRKTVFSALGGLAMVGILCGLAYTMIANKPKPEKSKKEEKTIAVKVKKVTYSDLYEPIVYHGRIRSTEIVSLSSEVSGRILNGDVPLKEGQTFRKGQVLVNIYSDDFRASLMADKSNFLTSLAGTLPDIEVDYPTELGKWKKYFSDIQLEKPLPPLPAIKSDKEKVFMASRNILSAYYNIRQREITLTRYKIRAPFHGVFSTVNLEVGAIASPGQPLGRIIRTDRLEAVAEVMPEDASWIAEGNKVEIHADGKNHKGTVIRKAAFVDPATQTVKIYIRTEAPVLEGQFIELVFNEKPYKSVMNLPREAVFETDKVFTVENGKLKQYHVEVVKTTDDTRLVRGLKEGLWVVQEALVKAEEGMEVRTLK
ncbi:hypothetical protein FUAX_20350 [Fulvitalea axinellae]|uniref:Multidrug resistance protein MdtA-like barrel-sandwich hybrid domain-containing protein n=1 Tax=Fulvitalea axinellae TaxID=1182444 RepID=A0AAU9CNH8_9BACT|nr:hypothetical protein FUAX_20350 [Fulvitalea axinellae]